MNLSNQRTIAAHLIKAGKKRIWLNPERATDIKEAITRDDIRRLIKEGTILIKPEHGISRARARHTLAQKRKGRRAGLGSRKGAKGARHNTKDEWVMKIRLLRETFRELRTKKLITNATYRSLRTKSKGGFFRSVRHVKLFLTEHDLWQKKQP